MAGGVGASWRPERAGDPFAGSPVGPAPKHHAHQRGGCLGRTGSVNAGCAAVKAFRVMKNVYGLKVLGMPRATLASRMRSRAISLLFLTLSSLFVFLMLSVLFLFLVLAVLFLLSVRRQFGGMILAPGVPPIWGESRLNNSQIRPLSRQRGKPNDTYLNAVRRHALATPREGAEDPRLLLVLSTRIFFPRLCRSHRGRFLGTPPWRQPRVKSMDHIR